MIGPKRLFWKIFIMGLLLVGLAAGALVLTTVLLQPETVMHGKSKRLHQVLNLALGPHLGNPRQLREELGRIAAALEQPAAIYAQDGRLLASAGDNPPEPLEAKDLRQLGGWRPIQAHGGVWVHAVPLAGADGPYLLTSMVEFGLVNLLPHLTAVLLLLVLVSWFLARALAAPLERLMAVSGALAQGDLSARSGISRCDEVGDLARAVDEMAGRLEERIRTEKELFANISHEIRTPLARLRVALELLEDAPGDAPQTLQRLQAIGADLTELELLVDNVLISSRLDLSVRGEARLPLKPLEINLAFFFAETAARFLRHYPQQPLETNLSPNLPVAAVDPSLLDRACDNLLDNAAKYNRPGQPVILEALVRHGQLRVAVTDFGEGVTPEDLARLFEPFFRGDRCRSRRTGGTGLGLTLCKRIVEAHGGRITAQLNPGAGMTFSFELPLERVAGPQGRHAPRV